MREILDIGKRAAIEASREINRYYGNISHISNKNPTDISDYVTGVDKSVELIIRSIIKEHFPDHSTLGEEQGLTATHGEYKWIIDPIDGTKNFIRKLGQFGVSIGISRNNVPYIGIICDPLDDVIISAVKGEGVEISKGSLHLSTNESLDNACIAINFGKTILYRTK